MRAAILTVSLLFIVSGPKRHAGSGQERRDTNTKHLRLQGYWTTIYHSTFYHLPTNDENRIDSSRFVVAPLHVTKDKLVWNEKTALARSSTYDLEPDGEPWLLELLEVDDQRRLSKREVLYYVRDDFLIMATQPPPIRPVRFSTDTKVGQTVTIYRRGRLEAPPVSATEANEPLPKEAESIEGTWTKVYYEAQGYFYSLTRMEDLTKVNQIVSRKVPFMEHIPLEWTISKDRIEEGGEREGVIAKRYHYTLNPEEGALNMIPLDTHGNKLEKSKREAVYFVKDDFLFVRFQIEPQRWRLDRPARVFTSDMESKTGLLILRRGPLKLPKKD